MHVLIIGGAGMIGRKLAERLAKDGTLGGKAISQADAATTWCRARAPAGAKLPVEIVTGDLSGAGRGRRSSSPTSRT